MGRISSVEFMARLDDYYENIRPYFHLLTFTEKKTLAQYTINCACASVRAISCTWSSPCHDYCLQAFCLMSGGCLQFSARRLDFLWTKALVFFKNERIWRLKIKERTLWTLFLNISVLFNWLSSHVWRQHDHRFGGGIIAQKEQRCVERSTWTKERVRLWEIQKRNTHRQLNGREQTGDTQTVKELNILFRKPI